MPCFDEGINRDAAEFLRDWARAAPPPVAASPPAPAADRAVPTPTPPTPAALSRSETSVQSQITLDVWQSAWRDFAGFDALVAYFGRNRITAVNFNPGQSIRPGAAPEAYEQLRALVAQLRRGGVTAVNYLYAELEYDIAAYASFIRKHPDLGIDTIVDDSEFSDAARPRFERNMKVVRDAGLRYSAFVTVEPAGNSGVSDELRLWAIDNVDEPILMSYFSCALAEQKKVLRPYFEHADATGRERFLRVAILLGSKSVGLERSCERELDVAALQSFLCDLDAWCRRYKSYAGLVLETNKKLPPEVRRQ